MEDRKKHPFSPYLFPSPVTGGMYGPDCVARIHKKLLARAGIEEHIRFHDLRRTFATMALQNGVDPKTVSRMLGHYSAEFTLDVYTNVTRDMQKEAAQKIAASWRQWYKNAGGQEYLLSGIVLSRRALSGHFAVWVTVWVVEISPKKKQVKKLQKPSEII